MSTDAVEQSALQAILEIQAAGPDLLDQATNLRSLASALARLAEKLDQGTEFDHELDFDRCPLCRPAPPALAGHLFLQWKGTDACLDFTCPVCAWTAHLHGTFIYRLRCPQCQTICELPTDLAAPVVPDDPTLHLVTREAWDELDEAEPEVPCPTCGGAGIIPPDLRPLLPAPGSTPAC